MANIFTNQTAIATSIFTPATANGPIMFTFSGTKGPDGTEPELIIAAWGDSAPPVEVYHENGYRVFSLDLAPNSRWAYTVYPNGGSCNLSALDK